MANSGNKYFYEKDSIEEHYNEVGWPLGALGRILGLQFAPINIPLERRLQTTAVLFWMSTFLFMGFGSLFLLLYIFLYTRLWWVSVAYFTWYLGDRSVSSRGGRRWNWVRHWKFWRHFRDFFPAHLIKTTDLDPDKNYIFGYHPHGILSAGAFCHFATEGSNFTKLFPGLTSYLLTLDGHFHLPFYREFFMCSGAVSASKASMHYLLGGDNKGHVLGLVVGGATESLDCHPGQAVLHLSMRKGFCKIAIQHGASLVPTFSFGENDVYDQYPNPPGSKIRVLQNALQKVVGLAPCIIMGRGIFQYSFGIVPFRKPIYTVVGAPIHVSQNKFPSQQDIDSLHEQYANSLKELIEKYRHQYAENMNMKISFI